MAIGDPWDTSYNPRYNYPLKNQHTGKPAWMPDASDEVPQDNPLALKDRRKGRFCTEGCGCIDTYCSNLAGARCTLPPELAITIMRTPDGRYQARNGIENGEGETYHLKYSNGSWRGSRCCSHNADGSLNYACDPCKVSTLPNGKPSECHHANNKYKELDSNKQVGDNFTPRGKYHYDAAMHGEAWPRRGVDTWLVPDGYNETLPTDGTEMLKSSERVGRYSGCFNIDGSLQEVDAAVTDDASCKDLHGPKAYWNEFIPSWTNNDVKDRQSVEDLIGTELQQTQFSKNSTSARLNIKAVEKRIRIDKENYLVGYSIQNGSDEDVAENIADPRIAYSTVDSREGGCIEDGAAPIKKRPWCRNAGTGTRIRQQCTDTQHKNKIDCEDAVIPGTSETTTSEIWLYDDKSECQGSGFCYPPEETGGTGVADLSVEALKPHCVTKAYCEGTSDNCSQSVVDPDTGIGRTCDTKDDCEAPVYGNTGCGGSWLNNPVLNKADCIDLGEKWVGEQEYTQGYCIDEIGQRVPLDVPAGMTEQECRDSDKETWVDPSKSKKGCEEVFPEDAPNGTEWSLGSENSCESHNKGKDALCRDSDGNVIDGSCSLSSDENKTQEDCVELSCYETSSGAKVSKSEGECLGPIYSWKKGVWTPFSKKSVCEAADGTWYSNVWMPNDWVDWEYEKRSCCGGTILDEAHPFHTPQISGGARNTRKNTVCFTPYSEVILHTDAISGFIGDSRGVGCTSIGNQFDRQLFFPDIESYWTVIIRPCNFWGSCTEEGKTRPDPSELTGQPDNYFDTTCGEEVVLYLPVDQMLNCSNFNLTLQSEEQLRSGWKESEPMWDERMGSFEYGNPATNIAAKVGMSSAVTGAGNISGGFPGTPFGTQYPAWCMNPDANFDGIADGQAFQGSASGRNFCDQYVYYSSGAEKNRLANAKGAEVLHGFNIQPQPFKATEEKQNRAKSFEQALNDKAYWQKCVGHIMGDYGGGGHWFWNYGVDYFMYYDFVAWGEVYPTMKAGGHCADIAQKVWDYVETHDGFLRRGDCGYGNGALWVGWVEDDGVDNDFMCPKCLTINDEGQCNSATTCMLPDGTSEQGDCASGQGQCMDIGGDAVEGITEEGDCNGEGQNWRDGVTEDCCEWFKFCSFDICTNFDDVQESQGLVDCVWRKADTKEECERKMSNTGAGGIWQDGCVPTEARLLLDECSPVHDIPEELINIVLGEKVGECTCFNEAGDDLSANLPENECQELVNSGVCDGSIPPAFNPDMVGGQGSTYPVRENNVVKLRVDGPLTTELTDLSEIEDGFLKSKCWLNDEVFTVSFGEIDKALCLAMNNNPLTPGVFRWGPDYYTTEFGLKRRSPLSGGEGVGNAMTYWHHTGLFPKGEMASYVNDHCMGTMQHRRIQYASNERPIKITSRNHLLKDGDLVSTWDVQGNFGANVMTNRDWQETQWEDKIYSPCVGETCDEVMWPNSVCAESTICLDEQGNEIKGAGRESCTGGECEATRKDGSKCNSQNACEAEAEECIPLQSDGTCKEGFVKDKDYKFDNATQSQPTCDEKKFSCCYNKEDGAGMCLNTLWENPDSLMGCGSKWDGKQGNTFKTYCDTDKYYACNGAPVLGEDPPPMEAFVAKNVTLDTFDLFTCDKHPVDGRIKNKTNLDTEECEDESKQVCVTNAGMPYETIVAEPEWSVKLSPFEDEKYFGLVGHEAFEKQEWCAAGDQLRPEHTSNAACTHAGFTWTNNYSLETGSCDIDSNNNIKYNDCIELACYIEDRRTRKSETECVGSDVNGVALLWKKGNWSGGVDADVRCITFGKCLIVDNAIGVSEGMMTRDECTLLGKTFRTLHTNKPYTDGTQQYLHQCYDGSANADNHEDIIRKAMDVDELEKVCLAKHSKCIDYDGNDLGIGNESNCLSMGGTWQTGKVQTQYNECVKTIEGELGVLDYSFGDPFKNCFIENAWKSEMMLDDTSSMVSSFGVPSVGVWKTCPFTGQWDYWGNANDDVGVEAGYVSHLNADELDSKFKLGWGGPGYKWEERANDYYVQIEQKGICPVCCDHFMPRSLIATISDQPTEILNHIQCRMDPCDAPTANDSFGINDVGSANHDGYCCADAHHPCVLGDDVPNCESEFIPLPNGSLKPVTFGQCYKDGELLVSFRRDDCVRKRGGTFVPVTAPEMCDPFIRTRLSNAGTTNCRKCSEVYSSRHKVKTYAETGNVKSRERGLLSYSGSNCCEDGTLCERTTNAQDKNLLDEDYPYPTCEQVRFLCPPCTVEGQTCNKGQVSALCKVTLDPYGNEVGIDWQFEPCICFPNNVSYEYEPEFVVTGDAGNSAAGSCDFNGVKNSAGDMGVDNAGGCYDVNGNIVVGKERKNGALESDCASNEKWKSGSGGCMPMHIEAYADESCYDLGNSIESYDSTCPGLDAIDVPMEYDGVVWRSEWELMNEVGLKTCEFGMHRFHWPVNCRATGPSGSDYTAPSEIVAVGGDCDGCDMPQMGLHGILVDGRKSWLTHRNAKLPNATNDGHFIRLVMGCGNSIPSIDAYRSGDIVDGGFGPILGATYRDNGIKIWSEITNCTFTDAMGSDGLRIDRVDTGVSGSPPIFPLKPCISKNQLVKAMHGKLPTPGDPTETERVYTFAGRCIRKKDCGPKGPCHGTDCCTYKGRDKRYFSAPLWSGGIACSTGGDLAHRCQATGFDPLPSKPAEQFTVHYIKDVNPVTGEGTLVVPAYAPTFGGRRCHYENGTPVGIGVAELQDAELDTFGDFSRNNKSRNPYLPAGGTVITGSKTSSTKSSVTTYKRHDGIPSGDAIPDEHGDKGRGNGQFMEIKVANVAPLITKNPRKNRHLRIYDRSRGSAASGFHNATTLSGMNMLQRYDLPQPYGLNPWPVDHQTHSTSYSPWPKGGPHSPNALLGGIPTESLRKDPALSLNQPGRVGPMPTMDNLNRMFRYNEVNMGDGATTPIPEIFPFEPVQIDGFDNVYSDSLGACTNSYYKTKGACKTADHLWIPQFIYTKVTTKYDHDLADAEKLVISGSVAYPATCKGVRLGYCSGKKGASINDCIRGECVDTHMINSPYVHIDGDITKGIIDNKTDCDAASAQKQNDAFLNGFDAPSLAFKTNGQWVQVFKETTSSDGREPEIGDADKHICEVVFNGEWVVGTTNNEKDKKGFYKDENNDFPIKLTLGHEGFVEGCPVGCRLNGFYLSDPCTPPSDSSPEGQCFECVETVVIVDEQEIREMKCPLGPVDGNYVARKRGCQHAEYENEKDCEEKGWAWFGKITAKNEFAIHQEMELTIHDASQLRSNLDAYKPLPVNIDSGLYGTDWEYDLSNTPKRISTDAAVGTSEPLSSLSHDQCKATRGAEWTITNNTTTPPEGRCVDLSRLDAEFPALFGDDPESAETEEQQAIYDLCNKSDNCQFIRKYKQCLGNHWSDIGTCWQVKTDDSEGRIITDEETTHRECDALNGVFVGKPISSIETVDECAEYSLQSSRCSISGDNEIYSSEGSCLFAGGDWIEARDASGEAVYEFECIDASIPGSYSTPKECTVIGLGKVSYKGTPSSISLDERKMNVVTMMKKLSNLSSPEAIAMGHDVGIGLSPRNHKGVIYAAQVDVSVAENKGYDKYADPNWRAVWSRHGGAFDILIGYPPPENNCRQGNSDKPTNMDFYLQFDQICCNDKGALNFHKCEDKCWHHYYGPVLNDMEFQHGIPGDSILHVNVHE